MAEVSLTSRLAGRPAASKIVTSAPAHHRDIAVVEIGDAIGEGRQRKGVGAEIGFLLAITDRQRAAHARADQQALFALEDHRQRIGAGQPLHRRLGGLFRRHALVEDNR